MEFKEYLKEMLLIENFLKKLFNIAKDTIPKLADQAIEMLVNYLLKASEKEINEIKKYINQSSTPFSESLFSGKITTIVFILLTLFPNAVKAIEFVDHIKDVSSTSSEIQVASHAKDELKKLAKQYQDKVDGFRKSNVTG